MTINNCKYKFNRNNNKLIKYNFYHNLLLTSTFKNVYFKFKYIPFAVQSWI